MSQQCAGTTQKGAACKKRVQAPERFCHYHQPKRAEPKQPRLSTLAADKKPGFIYVYTLTSLHENNALWLKARNLPHTPKRDKGKWMKFESGTYTLIKVGMTTQTVAKRLRQWEAQCGHKLTCLLPQSSQELQVSAIRSLADRFRHMSLSSIAKNPPTYVCFQPRNQGFYVLKNVAGAESEIHTVLHQKYGRGDVLCGGCKENRTQVEEVESRSKLMSLFKENKKEAFQHGTFNVHVEWFLVPKKDLYHVFTVIDTVCKSRQYF